MIVEDYDAYLLRQKHEKKIAKRKAILKTLVKFSIFINLIALLIVTLILILPIKVLLLLGFIGGFSLIGFLVLIIGKLPIWNWSKYTGWQRETLPDGQKIWTKNTTSIGFWWGW